MPIVRARVVNGQPCLQVLDASDQSVRMAYIPDASGADAPNLHALFRELFLAGARERQNTDEGIHHRTGVSGPAG